MAIETLYPAIKPSLDLNFGARNFDPRITFSRASGATYYDGKTVAKAEENLFTYSQDFDNGLWAKGDSTIAANTDTAPDGTVTADTLTAASTVFANGGRVIQDKSTLPTGTYTLSVWIKRKSGTGKVGISLFNTETAASATALAVTDSWQRFSITSVVSSSSTFFPSVILEVANDSIAIWGAQLEQRSQVTAYTPTTTQPITNYIPALQTALAGVPRIDFDPITGECKGFLVEEQRTNMVLRSEDFTASVWPKSGCSIYADQTVAPDGTLSADLVEFSGSGQINSNGSAATVSGAHTFSFFVKPYAGLTGTSQFLIRNGTTATNLLNATLTWSNMTVSANGSITSLSNGWYRLSITVTSGISVGDLLLGYPISGSVAGLKFFLWGAQLELGAFPTSYIKTDASQVTRAADLASMTGANFSSWYCQYEGSICAEFQQYAGVSGASQRVLQIAAATANDGHLIFRAADLFKAGTYALGVYQASSQITESGTESSKNKVAYGYKLNSFIAAGSGKIYTEDTSGVVPQANSLYLGVNAGSANSLNGYLRKVSYYPKRLTDVQLQALTV